MSKASTEWLMAWGRLLSQPVPMLSGSSLFVPAALLCVGFAAGMIDTIAGGGGLITLPALILSGLSPAQAIATNKLQSSFGTASAAYRFSQEGQVTLRPLTSVAISTLAGAATGAATVQFISPGFLFGLIPWLLAVAVAYFALSPRVGNIDTRQRVGVLAFAVVVGFPLGFYDGFFGPGVGALWAVALVSLLGRNLRRATAETKVLNLVSNLISLVLFALGGNIIWSAGLAMGAGQVLGARIGAALVVTGGARLIRPLLIGTTGLAALKLLSNTEAGAAVLVTIESALRGAPLP